MFFGAAESLRLLEFFNFVVGVVGVSGPLIDATVGVLSGELLDEETIICSRIVTIEFFYFMH